MGLGARTNPGLIKVAAVLKAPAFVAGAYF